MASHDNQEAAFVAKITAGATHEFRNVLAIVKESAGLIEDLLSFGGRQGAPDREKVLRAVNRIRAQVNRGAELMTALNRFAHCLDRPEGPRDLLEEVRQVAFLSQRDARPGRHRLEVAEASVSAQVSLDALWLQMALFAAVRCCLDVVPDGGWVLLSVRRPDDRVAVEFTGSADGSESIPPITGSSGWSLLGERVEALGGAVELLDDHWGFQLLLPVVGAE
jgi:C4-dicarboxylate-specific signal transduction histidine kinase